MLGSVRQMLSCVYSMNVCVRILKIWLCVPNENTSFYGKESSCKGSVRFSILCVRFSVFCVQFWESRYCFEKRVLTIVKNCKLVFEFDEHTYDMTPTYSIQHVHRVTKNERESERARE